MSILEHKPNTNLKEIPTTDVEELRNRLRSIDLADDEQCGALLLDILSNYASLNTQTITGHEFQYTEQLMMDLFGDCFDQDLLTMKRFDCFYETNPLERGSLIIAPKGMDRELNEVFAKYISTTPDEQIQPLETDRVVLHVHIDTVVADKEGKAGFKTFYDKKNDLVYCRGANDMKMSVAALALVYEKFRREGVEMPVLIVTSDEESNGDLGGLRLARCIKSNTLNLDLEPTACIPGNLVTKISPSFGIEGFSRNFNLENYLDVRDGLRRFFSNYSHPMITYSEGVLGVSVNNEGFSMNHEELKNYLTAITGQYMDGNYFGVKMNNGKRSTISRRVHSVVSNISRKYFQVKETNSKPISVLTRGMLAKNGFWGNDSQGILFNNFECMMSLAHPDGAWGILGPDELGGGRHEKNEAAKVSEGVRLGHAVFEIVRELHDEITS